LIPWQRFVLLPIFCLFDHRDPSVIKRFLRNLEHALLLLRASSASIKMALLAWLAHFEKNDYSAMALTS